MDVKELAEQYEVKVFERAEDAEKEGYTLLDTARPRNVWNRQSAAQAAVYKLVGMRRRGEASSVGLVLDTWSVTGCYKRGEAGKEEA